MEGEIDLIRTRVGRGDIAHDRTVRDRLIHEFGRNNRRVRRRRGLHTCDIASGRQQTAGKRSHRKST